jgi:hypothetical protein
MDGLLDWVGVGGHLSIYYGCPFTPRTTLQEFFLPFCAEKVARIRISQPTRFFQIQRDFGVIACAIATGR